MRSSAGIVAASALSSVVLPVPVPPEIRTFFRFRTASVELLCQFVCEGSDCDEFLQGVTVRELPHGQRRPVDRARRKHRGHSRAILEPRVERRLHLRDLVAAGPGDVLDGDRQVPDLERPLRNHFERPAALHEHTPAAAVHHHLGDGRIAQQILDRAQERQDAIQAAHSAPFAR